MKRLLLPSLIFLQGLLVGCKQASNVPTKELIGEINLKRGNIISCGAPDLQFGSLEFENSCGEAVKAEFNMAIKLLHSFEYDEAEKAFAKVIDGEPTCAMAYWGVAMANFHPLWTAPMQAELEKGSKAVQVAQSLSTSKRESDYINAIAAFYKDWDKTSHIARCLAFEQAMEQVFNTYPNDKEAAAFYALSLIAAADPNDKSYTRQKKAGEILKAMYPDQPNHPGIAHYLIHTYDYPELAEQALDAARKYASIAPSSAHALHMPSHIFTRLGLWDECIRSNLASVASAQCYAEATGIKGHWDEELHGLDYLMYAHLQKGNVDSARKYLDYLATIREVHPVNFKVAYAVAAIPSRYLLEKRKWEDAAHLKVEAEFVSWKDYPWQEAMIHFTRLMGMAHTNRLDSARAELEALNRLRNTLVSQKDGYKANQVAIQAKTGEAWIRLREGHSNEAVALMQAAAEMEDKSEKHPVTPGEILPARELLGDMLLQLNRPQDALAAYEADLSKHPDRFNGLIGASRAAGKCGKAQLSKTYLLRLPN